MLDLGLGYFLMLSHLQEQHCQAHIGAFIALVHHLLGEVQGIFGVPNALIHCPRHI